MGRVGIGWACVTCIGHPAIVLYLPPN